MWWTRFEANLEHLYLFASHWVATVWMGVFAFLQYKGEAWVKDILGGFLPAGAITPALFAIAFLSYIASVGWPQPKLVRKLEDRRDAQDDEASAAQ